VLGGPGQDIEPTHRGGRFRDHHSLNAHCGLAPDQRADGDPRGHLPTAVHRFPDNPAGSHGIGGRGCAWRHRRILFLGHCQRSYQRRVRYRFAGDRHRWSAPTPAVALELPGPRSQTGKPPTTQDLPDSDRILGITAIPVLVQVGLLSIWHDGPPSQVVGGNSPACIARRIFMTSISTRSTWQRAAVRVLTGEHRGIPHRSPDPFRTSPGR